MKNFFKGLIILALGFTTLTATLIGIILFAGKGVVIYNTPIHLNMEDSAWMFWIMTGSLAAAIYWIIPTILLNDTLWLEQDEINKLKKELWDSRQDLLRKINKL